MTQDELVASQRPTIGASIGALMLAAALFFIFSWLASAVVQRSYGGERILWGVILAFVTGYAAPACAKAMVSGASVRLVAIGVIVLVLIQLFMASDNVGGFGMVGYLSSLVGAAIHLKH